MLRALFKRRPAVEAGRALFRAVSDQSRRPIFYTDLGVADTVEGRFELMVLHLVLVLHRIKGEGTEAAETGQATFDAFLKNLDEGLRDMGVGDLSVGKKMRRLGEAVYGRIKGYDRALAAGTVELQGMIGRTLLEGRPDPAHAADLARYALAAAAALARQPLSDVLGARLEWPEVEHG
jgi:cytochrome b pre-mRNA-processing protein 3